MSAMWKFARSNISNANLLIKACESGNLFSGSFFSSYVRCSVNICNLRQKSCHGSPLTSSPVPTLTPDLKSPVIIHKRCYAKRSKDSGKKGKQQIMKIDLNDPEVMEIADLDKMKSLMESTIMLLNKELTEQLTLRVTLETVGAVVVETEDGDFNLCNIAQLQQKAQLIVVNLEQYPQYASKAKTSIIKSGINVTPQIDGSTLFLPIQKVTREHREKLAKSAKQICDKYKDKLKNIQNNFLKEAKSSKGSHGEDLIKEVQDYIMQQAKNFMTSADEVLAAKQKDVLQN